MAFGGRLRLFFALGVSSTFSRDPSRSAKPMPILLNSVSSVRSSVPDVEGPSPADVSRANKLGGESMSMGAREDFWTVVSLCSSVACVEDLDKERLRLPPDLELGLRPLALDDSSFFPSCKETESGKYVFVVADCVVDDEMSLRVGYGDMTVIVNGDTSAGESESLGKANESVGSSFPKLTRIPEVRTCAWAASSRRRCLCGPSSRQEGV
ncbi:hypothetical protein B0H14DRAFT_2635028 [Mycena olivaceomarginata]|nr:hypothetical protein B0H14DRAFT_2635028 [Mycena olivaceomarginata]